MNEGTKYTKNLALFIIILIIMASILYFLMFSKTKKVDGKDIDFSIDHISAKEAVCVGKIKLEKGINYKINISIKSGDKIFVALNVLDDITNAQGVEWKQYFETRGKKLEHIFTDMEIGEFYVYVGSKGEDLNNVEGSLSIIQ